MWLLGSTHQEAEELESSLGHEAACKRARPRAAVAALAAGAVLVLAGGAAAAACGRGRAGATASRLRGLISETEAASGKQAPEARQHHHHPRYARVNGSIETLWQRPRGIVRGLFFAAHGCGHQAPDYFSETEPDGWRFPACSRTISGSCLGLPEEVRFRRTVLARGYVFVAVSGGSGNASCWYVSDVARVKVAVEYVRRAERLESLPVFATGSSSGGQLLQPLAQPESEGGLPDLRCIVPMVSPSDETVRKVPTLFVYMRRDAETSYLAHDMFGDFVVDGIRAGEIEAKPLPLTAAFLGRCLDGDVAADVVRSLHEAGVLDKAGYLKADARERAWVEPVRVAIAGRSRDSLVADRSCLSELMNVAWSFHEFTGEFSDEIVDFCEGKWNGTFAD